MRAYSQDLREKVLRAVDQGHPREEIVKVFGVSRATIKRYLRNNIEKQEVWLLKPFQDDHPRNWGCYKPNWWSSCGRMTTSVWKIIVCCGSGCMG